MLEAAGMFRGGGLAFALAGRTVGYAGISIVTVTPSETPSQSFP
jgi:hypothetical protein